jgi:nucleoside-diphosphate-sugar epimerase
MARFLFVGGPGNISSSTVTRLVANQHDVAILKRNPNTNKELDGKVTFYYGDRSNPGNIKSALDDFAPDSVIDFIGFQPEQADQLSDLVDPKITQYVFVSTVDIYGYPLLRVPMRETDAYNEPNTPYASNKRAVEDLLWRKQESKGLPVTIVRPTFSFGIATGLLSFFEWGGMKSQVPRIRKGMPVLVPGDGQTLLHTSVAYNTGLMIAEILMAPQKTVGKAYTCGRDSQLTFDEYMQLVGGVVGMEPEIVHVPVDVLLSIDSDEIRNSFLSTLARYNTCFSVEAFKADFPDFKWEMSLEDGVKDYIDHGDRNGVFSDPNEEIYEDRVIRSWQKSLKDFRME